MEQPSGVWVFLLFYKSVVFAENTSENLRIITWVMGVGNTERGPFSRAGFLITSSPREAVRESQLEDFFHPAGSCSLLTSLTQ